MEYVSTTFVALFIFMLGLAVGSFLGAASYRIPRGRSIVAPPSSCPHCGHRLAVADLIPLVSHALTRGRCRHCGAPVSKRYSIIELLTGLGFLASYGLAHVTARAFENTPKLGAGSSPAGLNAVDWPTFAVFAVLYSLMLLMTVVDLEHMVLPDKVNIVGAAAGFGFALLGAGIVAPGQAIVGAMLGYAIVFVIVLLSRGGMGMGDAKFLAMIGTFVGPLGVLYTLFGASVLGSLIGGGLILAGRHERKVPIPFGPFLAAAAQGVWVYLRWRMGSS